MTRALLALGLIASACSDRSAQSHWKVIGNGARFWSWATTMCAPLFRDHHEIPVSDPKYISRITFMGRCHMPSANLRDVRFTWVGYWGKPSNHICGLQVGPAELTGPGQLGLFAEVIQDFALHDDVKAALQRLDSGKALRYEAMIREVYVHVEQTQITGVPTMSVTIDGCSPSSAPRTLEYGGSLTFAPPATE